MKSIEERLQAVEDRLEIYNVISAYGPVADGCNREAIGRVYAEDGVYDVRGHRYFNGLEELKDMLNGPGHLKLTGNGGAHVGTIPHVELDRDRAIATNYMIILHRIEGQPAVMRFDMSRLYLSRGPDGWRIDRRILDPLDGRESSRNLGARVFEGPLQDAGIPADSNSMKRS